MTEADRDQQNRPNQPTSPKFYRQRHEQNGHSKRRPAMLLAGEGVEDMTAIQLPRWKQVKCRRKEPHPSGAPDRMQQKMGMRDARPKQEFQQSLDQGLAEHE